MQNNDQPEQINVLLREQLEVVLVGPRNPLNIGAAARAMANFGFSHLAVAAAYAPTWREARSAVGAPQVLAEAREFATLSEAVSPCTLVLGTGTLTYRKAEQAVVPLPELAPLVRQEFAQGGRVALVFGSEKHGLSREDLALCHHLVVIPTDTQQPSMNLGQAVAVCLYELATRAFAANAERQPAPAPTEENSPVRSGRLNILVELVEETMHKAGYSPNAMQAANRHDLQLMVRRLGLKETDLKRLLGLFRRILWRLRHASMTD